MINNEDTETTLSISQWLFSNREYAVVHYLGLSNFGSAST